MIASFAQQFRLYYSVAALSAASACNSPTSATPPAGGGNPSMAAHRVVVLGDSLAVSPSPPESFPSHLQRRLATAGRSWVVVNAGVRGDTTADGLRRFDAAVPADTRILVLALGANDGLRGIDIAAIEGNLAQAIERAQARGIRVLLCGMETPPSKGWAYTLAYHQLFPRLAARYDVPLVPFLLAGVALNPEMNGPDEVHPNAAGARRIADTVWPYLEPLLAQAAEPAVTGTD
jgi:acyl-CoA thioesterase-1